MANDLVTLGYLSGCHGIQGWVKVFSHTDPPAQIFTYPQWQLHHKGQVHTCVVLKHQKQGKKLLAQLEGIESRNDAEALVGATIKVQAEALPHLPEGEYYWRDLIGLRVENTQGEYLGTVEQLQPTGANDVLVVVDDKHRRLLPYTEVHVRTVDIGAGKIVVDWELDY